MNKSRSEKPEFSAQYQNLSSKIRKIYIPLPDFKFFHRPIEADSSDSANSLFVGRERILAVLKNWLEEGKNNHSGSYLITGYRGMGKTSFVSKTINDLMYGSTRFNRVLEWVFFSVCAVILIGVSSFFSCYLNSRDLGGPALSCWLLSISILFLAIIARHWNKRYKYYLLVMEAIPAAVILAYTIGLEKVVKESLFDDLSRFVWIYSAILVALAVVWRFLNRKRYIIKMKVNIGNDINNTKDILSLLAYATKTKLTDFVSKKGGTIPFIVVFRYAELTLGAIIVSLLFEKAPIVLNRGWHSFENAYNNSVVYKIILFLNTSVREFKGEAPEVSKIIGVVILIFAAYFVWRAFMHVVSVLLDYYGISLGRPTQIIKELKALCERIDSSVKEDNEPYGMNVSGVNILINRKSTKQYQPASVREIEQGLTEVFDRIYKSPILNCRLIVVLDEMDKLNKFDKGNVAAEEFPEYTTNENGIADDVSLNEKRYHTLYLLGQMKYFVSTAKAKFVFIAGHELYDAYLADVSDREYSISSIFNGIINVDSFFTCNSQTKDITKLTEAYLCKYLMSGKSLIKRKKEGWDTDTEDYNLEQYHKYLESCEGVSDQEKEMIFAFLRQFVTYLTFVSNGAPKKLKTNFEKYVISKDTWKRQTKYKKTKDEDTITLYDKEADYYLAFSYNNQQNIGFIHYMAHPIFENIISPSSEYGDKLLIASSFLIAHIYKHHNSGFSLRNLEYLPELLDPSRTPELRDYINSLIGHISQIHLTDISSGIYSYKFPMKLVEEISMFTKKSEELSAIFNFSLDYSLMVKKYYLRLLDFYRKQGGAEVVKASLGHSLGDIHMANDEYTEAITQFRFTADSIETHMQEHLKAKSSSVSSLIIRYTRVMLKLGLAYEKRNSMDSAYLVYSDLTAKLIAHREVDEKELGLTYQIVTKDPSEPANKFWHGKQVILLPDTCYRPFNKFNEVCQPPFYQKDLNDSVKYWINGPELIDNLCDFLSPHKESLISKLSVYEDLRIAYMSILAKLFVLEKHNICGITRDNIKVAEAEFQYLFLITNSKDKFLLQVDFYRKLGDILYYKNRHFYEKESNTIIALFACWGCDIKTLIFDYCYDEKYNKSHIEELMKLFDVRLDLLELAAKIKSCDSVHSEKEATRVADVEQKHIDAIRAVLCASINLDDKFKDDVVNIFKRIPVNFIKRADSILSCGIKRNQMQNAPCFACRFYSRSLMVLESRLLREVDKPAPDSVNQSKVFNFLIAVNSKDKIATYRHNELAHTALLLESLGNTLLSCASKDYIINDGFIDYLLEKPTYKWDREISHIEKTILYYWTAMKYYEKASSHKERAQCLVEILNVLVYYVQARKKLVAVNPQKLETVVIRTIEAICATRDYNNLKEARLLRNIIFENGSRHKKINLSYTSIMPDVEELLLIYNEFMLSNMPKEDNEGYIKLIGSLYGSPSLSYLRNDSLIYNRMISLLFKAKLNERLLERLGFIINDLGSRTMWQHFTDEGKQVYKLEYGSVYNLIAEQLKLKRGTDDKTMEEIEELVMFLITDSVFCLYNITDIFLPTARTTLFTNSFCYEVNEKLYRWLQFKEAMFKESMNKKLDDIITKTTGTMQTMLKPAYFREIANKYRTAAEEMHAEGYEYQDFIKNFYILDDDLQNNTCQFYFALERYKINCEDLKEIPTTAKSDGYYTPDQYYNNSGK